MDFFGMAMSVLGIGASIAGGGSPDVPVLDATAVSEGASAASDVVSNIATDSGNTSLLDLIGNSGTNPIDNAMQASGTSPVDSVLQSTNSQGYNYTAAAPGSVPNSGVSVDETAALDPTKSATGSPTSVTSQILNSPTSPGAAPAAPSGAATNAPSGQPALSSQLTGEGAFGSANAGTAGSGVPGANGQTAPPPGTPSPLDAISKYVKDNAGLVEVGGGLLKGAMTQLGPQAAKLNAEANYLNQKATEYDKTQAYNELMRQRYIDSVNGMGTKSTAIDPNSALFSRPGLINGARSA